jgi:hypothetical protein
MMKSQTPEMVSLMVEVQLIRVAQKHLARTPTVTLQTGTGRCRLKMLLSDPLDFYYRSFHFGDHVVVNVSFFFSSCLEVP